MNKGGGSRKKRTKRSQKHGRYLWIYLITIFLFIVNLFLLDALIGIKLNWHFLPKVLYSPFSTLFKQEEAHKTVSTHIPHKGYPQKQTIPKPLISKPKQVPQDIKKRVIAAIVIDDLGYNTDTAEELLEIDFPFTVSILPNLPYSRAISRSAAKMGKEVIMHLPMEPYDYPNIRVEKGTLLTSMEEKDIRYIIKRAIDNMDNVVGVNNHMGSRMIENREKMSIILDEIKRNGLFFLDSRTSPRSVVPDIAQEIGVKSAERDVFLDGKSEMEYIHSQLNKVIETAKQNGFAIAIGHLNHTTIQALKTYLPMFQQKGVELVKLSEVVQ